jgi:hypothetical protein
MTRTRTILAATTAALAAGAIAAGAASKPKDATARCVVSGAETMVANGDVRVYSIERGYAKGTFRTSIYACSFRTGKRLAIGTAAVAEDDNDPDPPVRYIRSIKLTEDYNDGTGAFIAFVDTNCTKDPCKQSVVIKSTRTGKTVRRLPAGSGFDRLALSQPTDQDGFALAWLETGNAGGTCEGGCRVHLVKNSGDKVLDEGADIDSDFFGLLENDGAGIVRFTGTNEFVWKRGDTIKSASFND